MAIQQGRWSVYAGSYVHWSYVGHSILGTKERYAPYTAPTLIPSYRPYICWGHPSSAVYGSRLPSSHGGAVYTIIRWRTTSTGLRLHEP